MVEVGKVDFFEKFQKIILFSTFLETRNKNSGGFRGLISIVNVL